MPRWIFHLQLFSYLSTSCLVCATVPRFTSRNWNQSVDKVRSTVFHFDFICKLALARLTGEADRPNYFPILNCRLSTIHPA